jgi:osmoprotectant transport system permease protein
MRSDLASEILQLTAEHLILVVSSMALAILIGVPLGIVLARQPALRRWVLGFASIVQTIPSLALFGFLIPIPLGGGIGKRTVIVSLVLYALLPILRNTYAGSCRRPGGVRFGHCHGDDTGPLLRMVQMPLAAQRFWLVSPRSLPSAPPTRSGDWRRRAGRFHFPRRRLGGHGANSSRRCRPH